MARDPPRSLLTEPVRIAKQVICLASGDIRRARIDAPMAGNEESRPFAELWGGCQQRTPHTASRIRRRANTHDDRGDKVGGGEGTRESVCGRVGPFGACQQTVSVCHRLLGVKGRDGVRYGRRHQSNTRRNTQVSAASS